MSSETFMSKLRNFFGLRTEPPRNDFRNPIWGSDDDEDDGDELYSRHRMDIPSQIDLHRELTKHMQDMFKTFGGMFGDFKTFFNDDHFDMLTGIHDPTITGALDSLDENSESDNFNSNNIRDYYLKPGYQRNKQIKEDIDLDGKISSDDISGLLKKKDQDIVMRPNVTIITPFDGGDVLGGRGFSKTVITTSVTKPDGTVETRRIVKSGNDIIEETTTSNAPDSLGPYNPGLTAISGSFVSDFNIASLFKNFHL